MSLSSAMILLNKFMLGVVKFRKIQFSPRRCARSRLTVEQITASVLIRSQ